MNSKPSRSRRTALAEGITAGIVFGTAAIFIRLLGEINVFAIAFGRLIIASVALTIIAIVLGYPFESKILKRNVKKVLVLGVLVGFHFIFFISSVKNTTILNATVLVNTSPVLAMIISILLFRVKPSRLALLGLLTSFLGVSVIGFSEMTVNSLTLSLQGDLEAVLAALCEAFYLCYGRELRTQMPLLSMMIPIYAVSALVVLGCSVFVGAPLNFPSKLEPVLLMLGLGVLPTAIGHTLFFSSLSHLKPFETATLALLEPVGATLLGVIFFSEVPGAMFVLGAFLVLSGVNLVVRG